MEDEEYGFEREQRKRKIMLSPMDERKERRRRSPSSPGERRRSPSGGSDYDERRKRQEEWKRKSESFLKALKADEGSQPGYERSGGGMYSSYPPQEQTHFRDEKSMYEREKRERSDTRRDNERGEEEVTLPRGRPHTRSDQEPVLARSKVASESPSKEKRNVLLTPEQRDKLIKQRQDYEIASEKLEDQLLKLKEQRELLKTKGHKHEDPTMKENAKLQKEVKHRIGYMKEYIEKMIKGLDDDLVAQKEQKEREKERVWREEQRIKQEREKQQKELDRAAWERERPVKSPEILRRPDISRQEIDRRLDPAEGWPDKLESGSRKVKEKKLDVSVSSSSESEVEQKKKRKKKKKKAASESESEPEMDKTKKSVKKEEDDILSLMQRKRKPGKDEDNSMLELIAKLSEGYNRTKQELAEMTSRCSILENQNRVLKKQVEELNGQIKKQETTESRTIRSIEPEPPASKSYQGPASVVKDEYYGRQSSKYSQPEYNNHDRRVSGPPTSAGEGRKGAYDYDNGKDFGSSKISSGYKNASEEYRSTSKGFIKEDYSKEKLTSSASKGDSWKHDKFEKLERGESPSPEPRNERDSHTRRTDEYSRFMKEYEETSSRPKPRPSSQQKDQFYELKKKEQSDDYSRGGYHKKEPSYSPEDKKRRVEKRGSSSEAEERHKYKEIPQEYNSSKKHYEEESKDKHYEDYEKRKKPVYEAERDRYVEHKHKHYGDERRHHDEEEHRRRQDEHAAAHYQEKYRYKEHAPAEDRGRHESKEDSRRRQYSGSNERHRHESGESRRRHESNESRQKVDHEDHAKYERYYGGDVEQDNERSDRKSKKKKKQARSRSSRSPSDSRSRSRSRSKSYERSKDKKKKKDKHRSRSSRSSSRTNDKRRRGSSSGSASPVKSKVKKDKNAGINLDDWSGPPKGESKDPLLYNLKEKIKAKEAERRAIQGQAKWQPAEPTPPKEPPTASPVQQVKTRESLERGLSPSRPSLKLSWGQGVRSKTEQAQVSSKKSAAPIVGKMPWLKPASASTRASKFGPPVTAGVGITPAVPPPKLVTAPVKLGGGTDVEDTPLPPLPPPPQSAPSKQWDVSRPPPGMQQQQQQKMPQHTPPLPLMSMGKIPRNPQPRSQVDINEMLAAAQRHMQHSINTKLSNIGLPPQDIRSGAMLQDPADNIPLPESIPMPDPAVPIMMPTMAPPEPGPGYGYGQPPPEDIHPPPDYAPATVTPSYGAPDNYSATNQSNNQSRVDMGSSDPAPPGEGPDPEEMAMLGIDPEDSIV